ncbi:MAG: DEAD/DEAH box helicase [Proteobacteria bacterium]|nr:MAG: DEAD/DEAH box helicase [Pseudomonadota bacterium]
MYQLRPYQQIAVDSTIRYFQKSRDPAVLVLPTGAGKSLVIAELARIAKGRVLVLAHVKELVEQNHGKYESYGLDAGIYSAGLDRKDKGSKVIFGSIQSVARAGDDLFKSFSLLIIDECHRVSIEEDTQYAQVIKRLRLINPSLCVLGLTATPYRLGLGWIYQFNHRGLMRTSEQRFFKKCIYDLTLSYMIQNKYLTPPIKIDSPVASYDFSSLKLKGESFKLSEIEHVLKDQERVTPGIIANIIEMARDRAGVMIFTSSVRHAEEIMTHLPSELSAMVVGDTASHERDLIIKRFKEKNLKFLVNVSVLTTGFDAPHVDLIAILRPTESVSLYQQIVGRGLRLAPGKKDCLILDYTGVCTGCQATLVDNDKKLKEAMSLKDAHVMRPDSMQFDKTYDKKGNARIEVKYYDYDGEFLREFFYMNNPGDYRAFYYNFMRMHLRIPERKVDIRSADDVLQQKDLFRVPMFVIARKKNYYWEIREKIFE